MPRKCSERDHENLKEITSALVFNEPLRDIADRWSVSKTDFMRHRNRHLPVSLIGVKEAEEEARADNLLNSRRYVGAPSLRRSYPFSTPEPPSTDPRIATI